MARKKVMIGVPMHKGDLCAATMHSVVQGASGQCDVQFQLLGLSLLAKNFNMLFISAFTKGYDYFILHHSDLGVAGLLGDFQGSWVDLLVHRIDQLEAAALSVVIPIKSPAAHTSTALETVSGDPYSLRRLTIRESERCAEDFINRADLCELFNVSEDKAGALLINTGLMIMDLKNVDWAGLKWPGFTIEDTIEWNKSGKPSSYTIPEDWHFSRWMHYETDLDYYATRELVVSHVGHHNFMNNGGWGDETDCPRQQPSIEDYRESR